MKKVIRLSESELVNVIKMILKEQEGKKVTVKDLKRDGYDVEVGDFPLSSHKDQILIDNDIKSVGQNHAGASLSFRELLKQKGINPMLRNKGFKVIRKLSNGNIELKWITIVE